MSKAEQERIMMVVAIIERGKAKPYIEMLRRNGIGLHTQCLGQGTASSEMMDILGLVSSNKDILISYAARGTVEALATDLTKDLSAGLGFNGLMMLLSTSAVNRLVSEMLLRRADGAEAKGEERAMKSEYQHSLILITVNQGYTDSVMQTARKAGATGGTVIRARMAGAEQMSDPQLTEEKEIIAILAPDSVRNRIMEEVNQEYGMRSEAKGIVCAVPVDKALKV